MIPSRNIGFRPPSREGRQSVLYALDARREADYIPGLLLLKIAACILFAITSNYCYAQNPSPCTSPEYRQFDFWIGDWDVFEPPDSGASAAHVRVDGILGGCVLQEHYEDKTGAVGESFTTYDVGRKVWHQTWVTNRGRLLTIEGSAENGVMTLSGAYYLETGKEVRVRGIWAAMGGTVRESAVTSSDAGKTWQRWFDLSFRPRVQADKTAHSDDVATVARLDEQFQAAVKANDARTIDKIVSDDFILVTGSGDVLHKQQLLDEAHSLQTTYEQQEDTERSVRVWSNTAVVTAKLRVKGVRGGKPIDYTLWFSDTYIRMLTGWRYVFGQASLPHNAP